MDLALNEIQEMLKAAAANFMKRECPKTVLTQWDRQSITYVPEVWNKIAELGWVGMLIPAEYGGGGSSFTDAAVVFEELGRGPLPGPHFSSGILSALTILEGGSEEQKQQLLPLLARGEMVATCAISDPATKWGPETIQMSATRENGRFVLNGTKLFVHDAEAATHFICAVRTAKSRDPKKGITLLWVDKRAPGIKAHMHPGSLLTGVGEINLDSVKVPATAVLGKVGEGWPILEQAMQKAIPVLCAYQVGSLQESFEMALSYSQTRIVFTQPIGRFQRVADHVIEVLNRLDAARWATYEALWKLDTGMPAVDSVHLAKVLASEGHYYGCNKAHEVFAGIGISRDFGMVIHTKMSRSLYQYLGDPVYHRRRLADALDF